MTGGELSRRRFAGLGLGACTLGSWGLGSWGLSSCSSRAGQPAASEHRKLGFVLSHEQASTAELVELAASAEQAGFGHLWASDHLQPWQDNQGHADFPWITLGLVSQRTRTARIGTGVTCPTYRHHPSEVAQAFGTLAELAPGRVFLGVGTGEAVNELAGTGQFGGYPERHDRLVEALELIRQLWHGDRVSFRGRYFQTEQLKLYPPPDTAPPIYVAAGGPRSAELAGRHGDGWVTTGGRIDPDVRSGFENSARAAGKDPARMAVLVENFVVVGEPSDAADAAQRWRFLSAPGTDQLLYQPNPVTIEQRAGQVPLAGVPTSWTVSPDPAAHIDAARRLLDAGATPFIHAVQSDPRRVIDFYAQHVLPALGR
jgi:F420-dependent hydroxymycolic acid dehydrogenase